ncbi:MAG: hypothetical protein ACTSPI_00610 [Candidatus Heimdallarchaeaceae archaeon]
MTKVKALVSFLDGSGRMRRRGTVFEISDKSALSILKAHKLIEVIESKSVKEYKKKIVEPKQDKGISAKIEYLGGGWYRLPDGSKVQGRGSIKGGTQG